jgi:membrane peptidoglycan carboxypeptidase
MPGSVGTTVSTGGDRHSWDHYQSGHSRLLGASTISMQTAKNVFLWPGRDWLRKGFEAWFTALIELAWGKRRIMEVYLNVAEWGPGVYGAEAAAQYYFHKRADALNPGEAVRLAAALPDPLDWSSRRPGRRLLARGAAIRANMQGVPMGLPALFRRHRRVVGGACATWPLRDGLPVSRSSECDRLTAQSGGGRGMA